ncbi:hypothetical protein AcV7_009336 [Taiwanofungus camphoratus]|nr:hypothetical protein AcV7_009336 [Antrodia cinnamomea]KAI0948660.1 hypothetical protein AcV7_009336 [Antrodia cinnamomea]
MPPSVIYGRVDSTADLASHIPSLARDDVTSGAVPTQISGHSESGIPKIGGSSAGFIVLVVALATIFLVSCTGVFILLRNHQPTPYERRLRQARRAREYDSSSYKQPAGLPGLRGKFSRLFGRKTGEGWVRAGDGDDEWDAADERPAFRVEKGFRESDEASLAAYSAIGGLPKGVSRMSTESVELSAPSASPPKNTPSVSIPTSSYIDPFTSSPTSTGQDNALHDEQTRDVGRFSVQSSSSGLGSVRSMRKFESGTKFKEGLDF